MRLSLLAQILDLLCPRHCLICGQRLLGEEEIICIACNLHLPRTNTGNSQKTTTWLNSSGTVFP